MRRLEAGFRYILSVGVRVRGKLVVARISTPAYRLLCPGIVNH